MNGVLGRWDIKNMRGIRLQIYDDSLSSQSLLYDSKRIDSLKAGVSPTHINTISTNFHGKKWILLFSEYGGQNPYFDGKVITTAISGLLINIFLFILILTLLNTKRNALRIADQLTLELKESESTLKAILDNSFDAIALHVDGICVMCNIASLNLFGFANKDEIIGHPILNVIAKSEHSRIKEYISKRIQGLTAPVYYTTVGIKTDGSIFDLEVSISTINHLNTKYTLVILRDITERKRAELQKELALERLNKIASRVPGVVYQFLLRPDGSSCFPFASDAIREIYRVEPDEVKEDASKVFENLHPDDFQSVSESINQSANQLLPWKHEYRVKFKDGVIQWLYGNAIPQKQEDGSVLWHGFITNITDRKLLEKELNEYTNLLKKSNEDLGNFAYAVSHDLKAPLNTVRGILNIIDNNKEEPNSTNKLEHIRIAKMVVDQMTRLIKDLLDYSRIDTNSGHFSYINLHEIINYILLLLKEKINKNNATVLINPLPQIYGDRTLINELFLNLLNNALIYHNENSVEIEVGFEEEQEYYKFFVRDNGIGIQEKEFEKIFIIFKRLHTQGEFAGTGIGLALCKRIVEFHNGKIWVESEYGKGSTFYFTIKKES
jgi:PAS domain S-box-containing protein